TEIQAQEASRQRIELRNGQVLVGVIESESTSEVVVLDASGVRTTIPRAQIRSIRPLAEGQFYRTDPNYTRLFFAPTARTLSRGSGRISTSLVLPSVAYGFTGWLDGSVAASIPVSGLNGIISLNAKARVAGNDTRAFAVGASAAFPYGSEVDG